MATASVRHGRSRGLVVAVTGAAAGPGRVLAARLADRLAGRSTPGTSAEIRKVIALDRHRGDVAGVTWRVVDIRDPLLSHRISDVDVIVHLDIDQSPDSDHRSRHAHNVSGAHSVLTAAAAARVRHVVVVTGAGPGADAGDRGGAGEPGITEDFAEIERLVAGVAAGHPEMACTVVRPAALVGPGVDTLVTRYFAAPRLVGLKGTEARWQFCHVDDLAAAVEHVVLGRIPGVIGVGCDGRLDPHAVEEITGRRRLDLPAPVVFGLAHRLHRMGLAPAPSLELRHVVDPRTVDCAALRAAGWKPGHDNASALRALMAEVAARKAAAGGRHRAPGRKAIPAMAAPTAGAVSVIILTVIFVRVRRGPGNGCRRRRR